MKVGNIVLLSVLLITICTGVAGASLVGYWKMDEGAGTTATCSVNSPANDGTLLGTTAFTTEGVNIDGADDGGIVTGLTGIAGANARTITAWIKAEPGILNAAIVSWGSSWGGAATYGHRFSMKVNNNNTAGQLRVEIGGGYVYGATPINDGQWHHVACTLAQDETVNANVKLYVDGVLETTTGGGTKPINSDAVPINIGWTGVATSQYQFNGVINEVRIYDEELGADEIAALVPEPATLIMLGVGGLGLLKHRRRN